MALNESQLLLTQPANTKPMRDIEGEHPYQVGDLVQVDGTRWVISYIPRDRRAVHLHRMNNSGCIWKTTLSKLPRKASR